MSVEISNPMPVAEQVDVGIVTQSLNHIIHSLGDGYARISGPTNTLMWTFVVLDITLFGIMLTLELDAWQSGFKKLLAISGWLYFIQDFERHANTIVNSLVSLGLLLGGQEGTDWRLVLDPSRLIAKGFSLTKVLLDNLPPWYQMGITDWLGGGFAVVLILVAFFILAANAYLLVIGFYLSLGVCAALLPFGLLPWTRSFAEKGIAAVVGHGVHLMLAAVATALAETVIHDLTLPANPTLHETWSMVFAVGTVAALAWLVPQRFAQGFMSGSVQLGAADATGMARPVAGLAAGIATGGAAVAAGQMLQAHADRREAGRQASGGFDGPGGRVSQSMQPLQRDAVASPASARSPVNESARMSAPPPGGGAPSASDPILSPPEP